MSETLSELVQTARALIATGLVTGAGGNVSARDGDVMWISPSGFSFEDASEQHYQAVDIV